MTSNEKSVENVIILPQEEGANAIKKKAYYQNEELVNIGINGKEQIQLFVALAQLAGHPVIYDVFPQNGRFSKTGSINSDPNSMVSAGMNRKGQR